MNTSDLYNNSFIAGKSKNYFPIGIAYIDSEIKSSLENVIIVYCYLGEMKNRFYDKFEFYDILTPEVFSLLHKSHFIYILHSDKKDSDAIMQDIKEGSAFTQ